MTDKELLETILSKLNDMSTDMTEMKSEIANIKSDITEMKSEIANMKSDITEIKADINNINLTLENEIRPNIMRVAEGHLDLARNLKLAQVPNSDFEILSIKVSYMESKIRELERKYLEVVH